MSRTNVRTAPLDAELILEDGASLIAVSGAGTYANAPRIVRIGEGVFWGSLQIEIEEIEIASNNESYAVTVQGSLTPDFSSGIENLAAMNFGANEVRDGGADDTTPGRYELPFVNVQRGVKYPYMRLFSTLSGSIASGIRFQAWVAPWR